MGLFSADLEPREPEAPAETLPKRLWQLLRDECGSLLMLNLTFILFCLPVVTIPAAVWGLHQSCWLLVRGKGGSGMPAFRAALRRGQLGKSWAAFGLTLPLLAVACYGCWFYLNAAGQSVFMLLPFAFCSLSFWVLLLSGGYLYALLCAGQPLGRETLLRAVALAFLHPLRALASALCHYGLPLAAFFMLPMSGAYLVLIGFSLPCLLGCLFAQKAMDRLLGIGEEKATEE